MLPSFALGLGELRVRNSLGQSFLAHADVIGSDADVINAFCVKAKVLSFDGALLANAIVTVNESANRRSLSFVSKAPINEPAVKLIVDINCEAKVHREFSILLDPSVSIQGAPAKLQIDPPLFGMQTLPDLVTTPLQSNGQSAASSKKQSRAQKQALDLANDNKNNNDGNEGNVARNKNQKKSSSKSKRKAERAERTAKAENTEQRQLAKANARSKPTKDVLKLSDDVLSYPTDIPSFTNQGLRMSEILSTQAGQDLLVNIEELRVAQARMAAILRDEPLVANSANSANLDGNPAQPAQLAKLEQLQQESTQLKKQVQDDQLTITSLKNKTSSGGLGTNNWSIFLIALVILLLVACAYLFYVLRKTSKANNPNSGNPSWWGKDYDANTVENKESIETIINNVQDSYDKQELVKQSFLSSDAKQNSVKQDSSSLKNDAKADLNHKPDITYTPTLEETNSSIFNFFSPRGTSVKVEEISDITQEAEFWISMNDPQRAIEILSPHENIEHPDSPLPWLFLLDLYKTVKNAEKYNLLRERFISFFNANIPEFDTVIDPADERHLDEFTHIMNHICKAWNEDTIIPYLESLLIDDREGKRSGFDLSVYRDILVILGVAHELERGRVSDGQTRNSSKQVPAEKVVDHLKDADIQTIEFEMIDFPNIIAPKKD